MRILLWENKHGQTVDNAQNEQQEIQTETQRYEIMAVQSTKQKK